MATKKLEHPYKGKNAPRHVDGNHPGGRPVLHTPDSFKRVVDMYFATESIYTMQGIALALGFCCMDTLYEYGARPEFSETYSAARLKVEQYRVKVMSNPDSKNTKGIEFLLKVSGMNPPAQELKHSGKIDSTINGTLRIIRLPEKVPVGTPVTD